MSSWEFINRRMRTHDPMQTCANGRFAASQYPGESRSEFGVMCACSWSRDHGVGTSGTMSPAGLALAMYQRDGNRWGRRRTNRGRRSS